MFWLRNKTKIDNDYNLPITKSPKPAPKAWETSWSALLNVSYYRKKYHYILIGVGIRTVSRDIKPFMK